MFGFVSRISKTRFPAAVASWTRLFTLLSSLIGGMSWKMAKRNPRNSLARMLSWASTCIPPYQMMTPPASALRNSVVGEERLRIRVIREDGPEVPAVLRGELPVLELLHAERLHHLHAGDGLVEHRRQVGHPLLHQPALAVHTPADRRR